MPAPPPVVLIENAPVLLLTVTAPVSLTIRIPFTPEAGVILAVKVLTFRVRSDEP